jgi:hypothetical protein
MRIGCGVVHGFWKGSVLFLAQLSGELAVGCGGADVASVPERVRMRSTQPLHVARTSLQLSAESFGDERQLAIVYTVHKFASLGGHLVVHQEDELCSR